PRPPALPRVGRAPRDRRPARGPACVDPRARQVRIPRRPRAPLRPLRGPDAEPQPEADPMTSDARAIFAEPWWLEAVAPGAWGEAVVEKGGRVAARMPWVRARRRGATLLVTPPLTKTLGPWIRAESGRTTSRLEREKDL